MDYILKGLDIPSPTATSPIPKEKGLQNFLGENNCFLNVVIQALWHLDSFRLAFNSPKVKKAHKHVENCVYCALEVIFTQYEFSTDSRLPPTALRETMSILFKSKERFQLFELDDASEAFEAVLDTLHSQLSHKIQSECNEPSCIPHRVFGISTSEQIVCSQCDTRSEPLSSTLFTVYTYAAALRSLYIQNPRLTFSQLLRSASEDKKRCPNPQCGQINNIYHFLASFPAVFSVSFVWDSPEPSLADIKTCFEMINSPVRLGDIFDLEGSHEECGGPAYHLKGMICYYGKHYNAYFKDGQTQKWYVFDDTTVKPIGLEWKTVEERCLRGRLQPSVLFFEKQNFTLDFLDESQNLPIIPSDASNATLPNPVPTHHGTSSIIPVSKVIHSTIEPEHLDTSLAKRSEESFVFIPTLSGTQEVKDFVITRTNWMYRRQVRILRLAQDKFMRVEPSNEGMGVVKDTWNYHDIFDVVKVDDNNIVINFYSGKEPQYIHSDRVPELIECLTQHALQFQHTFQVKQNSIN